MLNQRRLQAATKVKKTIIRDLLFADDCALTALSEPTMQKTMDKFSRACTNFGLTISIPKTVVQHQPKPGNQYHPPNITVNTVRLKDVDRFTYTSEAHCHAVLTSIKKSIPELQRQVAPLVA